MKYKVVYNHFSKHAHTSILLTGCRMLERQGVIDLTVNNRVNNEQYPSAEICGCELIVNGTPAYFDCFDGYAYPELMEELLKKYDYYFKRSYSEKDNERFGENSCHIYSLGLNYQVYIKRSDRDLFCSVTKGKLYNKVKAMVNNILATYQKPSNFEKEADFCEGLPKICFMTRLWDSAMTVEERDYINSSRIELIRRIKNKYPQNAYVGVFDNKTARELCPDLILSKIVSLQPFYLKKMKSADICIGTMGLFRSIGWKTAEYVAASRAIVQEKMYYSPPGNFKNGKNYLEFSTIDECMDKIEFLVQNPDVLYKLKKNNERYYREYVSPDQQVLNAIKIITSTKADR